MSVINQMLKDLDERKSTSENTSYGPMIANKQGTHSKLPWIIVAVLSVILLAWVFKDMLPVSATAVVQENSRQPQAANEQTYAKAVPTNNGSTNKTPQVVNSQDTEQLAIQTQQETKKISAEQQAQPVNEVPTSTEKVTVQATNDEKRVRENIITQPVIETTSSPTTMTGSRVVKVSPQLDLRARSETLYEKYTKENGVLSNAQYERVLELDPDYHEVRISWLSQLSQQKAASFEQQSLNAIQRWPEVYQYRQILARNWVVTEPQKAYQLLLQQPPTIAQAPDYHGLIAYSAKQMGDLSLASKQYQLLLKSFPERADWWLALALAEDQLQRSTSALRAYQQSLRFPGLAKNIQAYAEQRVRALQGY